MTHSERIADLVAAFERQFGVPPRGIAEAPGRVNLIGEHVDYNDGLVLPFAIDRSVLCAWLYVDEPHFHCHSVGYDTEVTIWTDPKDMSDPRPPDGTWVDYVRGVIYDIVRGQIIDTSQRLFGGALTVSGNVPQGAGLSSSAALEVAVAGALRDAFALDLGDVALARLCQRAENEYVGVQCGIMDQFASALSKRDHALLIDCRTLAYEYVPLQLAEHGLAVVIANSAIRRELASSAYNDRRRECGEAVAELRARLGRPELASLRDVTPAELERIEIDTVPLRRARHVVGEIARVAAAVEALRADGFEELGRLMGESHLSLRDDYEVSSPELDLLVGLATAQEYVLGARLTGAGFGGCTVNLVRADAVEAFARDVIGPCRERTGLPAVMYVTTPQDGLHIWRREGNAWVPSA